MRPAVLACVPTLADAWDAWTAVTAAADPWLDTLTADDLSVPHPAQPGNAGAFTFGTLLLRMLYYYWFHTGENMAIRQMLGQTDLPQFVGNIDAEAPYVPEYRADAR